MQKINHQAPVKCSKEISIAADKKKVWAILTDISSWPSWNTDISDVTVNAPMVPGTSFTWKTGGVKIRSTLHTVDAFSTFGWTGKTFGMYAVHNWRLREEKGGTTVVVDESMEGLLAKIFKGSFNKNLEKGMQKWLDLLKQQSEK